jgi:prepilin-type N-terminal cleavage/methylation domain-containing protein
MLNFNKYKNTGFTLAEVLITLLIIGVVASLVIPNLINDSQNEELSVLLKKNYSAFADAARLMMIDNGGNLAGKFAGSSDMLNQFGQYITFTKKCNVNAQGCYFEGNNSWKILSGGGGWFSFSNYYSAVTNQGASLRMALADTECEHDRGAGSLAEHTCGWMTIDVNGFKAPNIMGRDLFTFWITKTGVYPNGIPNDDYDNMDAFCNKMSTSQYSGISCAAKILGGGKVD